MKKFIYPVSSLALVAGFVVASLLVMAPSPFPTPSTANVKSLTDGLHIAFKASDRIGFHDATPIPKPIITSTAGANIVAALAAQGLIATATPSSTSTPTATATPTTSP